MRFVFMLLIIFNLTLISAVEIFNSNPQIIISGGYTNIPVSFFNYDLSQTYTAVLEQDSSIARIERSSVFVNEQDFGLFNLIVDDLEKSEGVYFNKLIISNEKGIFQEVPLIIGYETRSAKISYDASISFNPNKDITLISGETILSPQIKIFKLDYNNPFSNSVFITSSVYSVNGELLSKNEDVFSVTRQTLIGNYYFNLGANPPDNVIIVVTAKKGDSLGLDIVHVSTFQDIFFSPSPQKDYPTMIYMSVFIFLLSFIMLISYLWYNHYVKQAKNWKSQIEDIKKIKFSDSAKGLRRLSAQKDVLQRAYSMHYISKNSYDLAMTEINKLYVKLKKRL